MSGIGEWPTAVVEHEACRMEPPPKIAEALVVGEGRLSLSLPYMLWRSGLAVDLITTSRLLRLSRFARRVDWAGSVSQVAKCAWERIQSHTYDWVIASDDDTLSALQSLDWPSQHRPAYLPVWSEKYRRHLHSKIGLSRVLSAGGIKTPAYRVAADPGEAISAAREIGYPVLLKVDASAGGEGVFECLGDTDIAARAQLFAAGPMLVQKKIDGVELDLSALYFDERLIHFGYSRVERALHRFGASVVRTYYPMANVPRGVFGELEALGAVTGASGFVNITCMEAADGSGRYYVEADMRPNVWVDFSHYYGEDTAVLIRDWFSRRAVLAPQKAGTAATRSTPITIAHFWRLGLLELMFNRYRVWSFMPWSERALVWRLLMAKVIDSVSTPGKKIVSETLRSKVRALLVSTGILP